MVKHTHQGKQKIPNLLLKQARQQRFWTLEEVASRINSLPGFGPGSPDPYTISRWERGISFPSPRYCRALCHIFELDAQMLGLLPSLSTGAEEGKLSSSPVKLVQHLSDPRCDWVNNVAWSSDDAYLAAATDSTFISLWDVNHNNYYTTYYALPDYWVNDVSWHENISLVAAACANKHGHGRVRVWSFPGGQLLLDKPANALRAVSWAPQKPLLAYAGNATSIVILNPFVEGPIVHYTGHGNRAINSIRWSPDGALVCSADDQGQVHLWIAQTGKTIQIYTGHRQKVYDISWSPDGSLVATASVDTTVQIWEPLSARHLFTYDKHTDPVHCVSWSPQGDFLASGGTDKTVQIWHAATGEHYATCGTHTSYIHAVLWAPHRPLLAVGCQHEGIELWQVHR